MDKLHFAHANMYDLLENDDVVVEIHENVVIRYSICMYCENILENTFCMCRVFPLYSDERVENIELFIRVVDTLECEQDVDDILKDVEEGLYEIYSDSSDSDIDSNVSSDSDDTDETWTSEQDILGNYDISFCMSSNEIAYHDFLEIEMEYMEISVALRFFTYYPDTCMDYMSMVEDYRRLRILRNRYSRAEYEPTYTPIREYYSNGEWIRDLTEEGVEPNPGPSHRSYYILYIHLIEEIQYLETELLRCQIEISRVDLEYRLNINKLIFETLCESEWIRDLTEEGIESNPGPHPREQIIGLYYFLIWQITETKEELCRWQMPSKYLELLCYLAICKMTLRTLQKSSWVRDLVREGVEPNPGPQFIKKFFRDEFQDEISASKCASYVADMDDTYGSAIGIVESFMLYVYQVANCRSKSEIIVAVINFIKHISTTGSGCLLTSPLTIHIILNIENTVGPMIQADDSNYMEMLTNVLESYDLFKNSKCYKKVYKLFLYLLSLSVFKKFGITMDSMSFTKIEQEALKKKYHIGPDFVHSILETLSFLYTRGVQSYKLGSIAPFYHDEAVYSKWANRVYIIKAQSKNLGNPEPHGITIYQYLSDLREIVDQGRIIVKSLKNSDIHAKSFIGKLLSDCEMLLCDAISKKEAQKSRDAPFPILLYGSSSIAKSTLTQLLFAYFGKLHNLPIDDEFIYTRNAADEYWVNFNTTQWCVLMDDIAYLNPDKSPTVDKTLNEIIQVVNSTAFVPTQAALEDKGRTPMRAKLVIATTNTKDIKANNYFSCPLAVQRRLPYVVEVKPKQEYLLNKTMIDGSKLPPIDDNCYPDYWDFIVYKVIPHELNVEGGTQYAKHQEIERFSDINEFLRWFGITSKSYLDIQYKEVSCKQKMRMTEVCSDCMYSKSLCKCAKVQAIEVRNPQSSDSWTDYPVMFLIWLSFNFGFLGRYLFYLALYKMVFVNYTHSSRVMRYFLYCVGRNQRNRFGGISSRRLEQILNVINVVLISSWIYKFILNRKKNDINNEQEKVKEQVVVEKTAEVIEEKVTVQGAKMQIGQRPQQDEIQVDNVWYKDDFAVTTLDISRKTSSMKGLDETKVLSLLYENCVHVTSYSNILDKKLHTKGFCVGGQFYLFNNHGIPAYQDLRIKFKFNAESEGVREQYDILVTSKMIRRFEDNDLCIIWCPQIRPRRKMTDLFCQSSLAGGHQGYLLCKTSIGTEDKFIAYNVQLLKQVSIPDLDITTDLWSSFTNKPTNMGDCGSILVSMSNCGPIILGIHVARYGDGRCMAIKVTQQFLECNISNFGIPMIQSGAVNYSSEYSPQYLIGVHPKSEVRYVTNGNALVYGSFAGFRSKHKSQVGLSPICHILSDYGYKIEHGPPVMSGWEIWRNNLLPSLEPQTHINIDLMLDCAHNFANDLIEGLSQSDLSKLIEYDDFTVMNGAAGVRFVDKINRSTSVGFPFNKSKKYFLENLDPQHDLAEPVKFTKEIQERIDYCTECYDNNTQYHPIYMGSMKDEPRSFQKIFEKNTRLFTGGPAEHIFVTRRELLSYTKVIQENKFVSECAAGTIAQSIEWDNIYKYLTKYGEDRIFDGDYKKFDKSMESTMIIMVFVVITDVLRKAGASEQHINRCWCIGYDLAFAFINFNGTLIQFMKGHVSGEALTVLVNSHCNSLYLRYAYSLVQPSGNCKDFKKNINLMTYGDDFVGGVHPNCNFSFILLKEAFSKMGLVVTPADKTAGDYSLMNISKISFLKRSFRYEESLGVFVCPLELASIHKSLMVNVKSKTISDDEQIVACIGSAVREYFWYGKEKFQEETKFLKEVITKVPGLAFYVRESTFPSWENLVESFWEISKNIPKVNFGEHVEEST